MQDDIHKPESNRPHFGFLLIFFNEINLIFNNVISEVIMWSWWVTNIIIILFSFLMFWACGCFLLISAVLWKHPSCFFFVLSSISVSKILVVTGLNVCIWIWFMGSTNVYFFYWIILEAVHVIHSLLFFPSYPITFTKFSIYILFSISSLFGRWSNYIGSKLDLNDLLKFASLLHFSTLVEAALFLQLFIRSNHFFIPIYPCEFYKFLYFLNFCCIC